MSSKPSDRRSTEGLQSWLRTLVENPEYRATLERIGQGSEPKSLEADPTASQADRTSPVRWMQQFQAAIAAGVFPDGRALVYVANCFARYLQAEGRVSLDEAFGLKSTQRAGNPSAALAKDERRNRLCYEIYERLKSAPRESVTVAAEQVLAEQDVDTLDAESLARYYRKWLRELKEATSGNNSAV